MRRINYIVFAVFIIVAATSTSFAQTSPRIFGAGELKVDDGNGNNVYLSTKTGSLGIDNSGNVIPGVQTFPSNCALLDLSSVTKGFLPPRMTTFQETSICGGTPNEGLVVYNTTTHTLDVYNGSSWAPVGGGWQLTGNTLAVGGGTMASQNFIGTLNAQDFVIATNVGTYPTVGGAGERIRVTSGGNVGISPNGLPFAPAALFHVGGTAGVSDVRFSSLSGSPLLAPPLVPANDGITIAGLNGDLLKYDIGTVVGAVAWLRTGNTIADGNNKLGTLNDVAIDIRTFNTTRVTIGNSVASNAVTVTGNEQVNGNLSNTGNATLGTNAGTINSFGNGGGATSNSIGNNAATNNIGNSATTGNSFGNDAVSNVFGGVRAVNQNNNYGSSISTGNVVNDFGQRNDGGTVTNNIGAVGATANNIGSATSTNTVLGTTNINITGTDATSIGSTGGGAVTIATGNPNPLTLSVGATTNNLVMNFINQDNTQTNLLMLTGVNSGNVRTRTLSSLLTGSQGVEVSLVGSTLDAHFASTNLLSPFTSTRFINLNSNVLNFTTNGGANNLVVVDGGGAAASAVAINPISAGNGLKVTGNASTNNGINVDVTANPAATGVNATSATVAGNFLSTNAVGVGFTQTGVFVATNTGTGSSRAITAQATGQVVGAGGVDGIVASGTNTTVNLSRGIAATGANSGGGPTMGGQFTATGSGAGLATGINVTAGGSTSSNIAGDFGAAGANSIGVRVSGATTSLQTDNNNILGDGAGNDNTTVNISGTGNLTLNGIAQDNTTVSLLTTTGVGSPANGNVRYRQLSSLIAANQGLFLIPGVTPTAVLGSNLGGGEAANPFTVATRSVSLNGNTLQFLDGNGGGNVVMSLTGAGDVVNIDNASVGTVRIANGGGATTVVMGQGASSVKIGQGGALNEFGTVAPTNLFGDVANSNFFGTDAVQNWLGFSNSASNVINNIGTNINTGTVTNNIGVQGGPGAVVTNISNPGTGTVNIGNTGAGGNVTIAASPGHPITIDVANPATNNLTINSIAQDLTQTNFLMLTGVNSGFARTRTLGSLLTGSNGVEVALVGSTLDAHFAPNSASVIFGSPRFINTGTQTLSITGNSGGVGTTFAVFDGNTDNVGINNAATNNGATTIGNTTAGGAITMNLSGTNQVNINGSSGAPTLIPSNGEVRITGGGELGLMIGHVNGNRSWMQSYGNHPLSINELANDVTIGNTANITLNVSVGTNLTLNGIATDNTQTNLLVSTGAPNGNVRIRSLSGLIAANQGLFLIPGVAPTVVLGSNLGGGDAPNPFTVAMRSVSLNSNALQFLDGNGAGAPIMVLNGTADAVSINNNAVAATTSIGNDAVGNGTTIQSRTISIGTNSASQTVNVGQNGAGVNINNSGAGVTNINRSGTGATHIGNATGTDVTGRLTLNAATPLNVSASDGTNNQVLRSMGAGATPQWFTLQTDNATLILSDGVTTPFAINLAHANTWTGAQTFGNGGGTTTTIDPSGGGNFVLNNIANDNTTVNLLTLTGAGSGNVRYRTLASLINADQGTQLTLIAGVPTVLLGGNTNATNPLTSTRYVNVNNQLLNFTNSAGANNLMQMDGPNTRIYVNSNAPYSGPSVFQVGGDETPVNLDAHQLLVTGHSNSNLMLELGYNTTAINATIQSYNQGTGATPLLVQPMGGLTTVGGGGATQQLVVNGTANAVVGNTLAGNPTVWDLVVKGDQVTTGIAKFGGSIWIDGVSATNQIVSDAPMSIQTTGGNNIVMNPGGAIVTFNGSANPGVTNTYGLGTNALRWAGMWGNSLDVSTSVNAGTSITAGGNISTTAGNITAPAGTITADGTITTSNGNFIATNGGMTTLNGITSTTGNITATAGTVTGGAGLIATSGGANITGRLTLAGASSPLRANGTDGNIGDLLVSAGAGNTPVWTNPAAAGLVVASGGALANNVVMFTAANTICNAPMTVAAGNVTFTGSISNAVSITSAGNITSTAGNIAASAGQVSASGNITSSTGNLIATAGGVTAQNNITSNTGNITATAGSVSAGTTVTAGTDVVATGGNINAVAGAIRTAGVDRISNNGTVNATGIRGGFVSSAAAPYAVVATDYFVKLTAGSNGATLPASAAANAGRIVVIRNISGAAVSITAGGSTIDGAAPAANNLGNGVTITYVSDGAGDWVSY